MPDSTVDRGDELASILAQMDVPLDRAARELIVLELYRRAEISAGYGANLRGMEKVAFVRWSGEMGIPYVRQSPAELDEDLRPLQRLRP